MSFSLAVDVLQYPGEAAISKGSLGLELQYSLFGIPRDPTLPFMESLGMPREPTLPLWNPHGSLGIPIWRPTREGIQWETTATWGRDAGGPFLGP